MLIPLIVLAVGALFAGVVFKGLFIGPETEFWKGALFYGPNNHILEEMEHVPRLVSLLPSVMMVGGFLVALFAYILRPAAPAAWARSNPILYKFLLNKWYFDELYDFLFVRPAFFVGRLFWHRGDQGIIDRFGPDGVSARVLDATSRVVRLQTGYVYHYAFAMLIGVAVIITWYVVGGVR
jgi:NADH-quinone oxidoreductase subunit L